MTEKESCRERRRERGEGREERSYRNMTSTAVKMTRRSVNERILDKHIEKQMGCMASFLHLFDRRHILSGKRSYSTRNLPPSRVAATTSESETSPPPSPAVLKEFGKPKQASFVAAPNSERLKHSTTSELRSPRAAAFAELPLKSPPPLPILELQEGSRSWRFRKESPRVSLDSRATTDAKGDLHRKEISTINASILATSNRCESIANNETNESQQNHSPSLEPLPDSSTSEPEQKFRSASELRVSRDLFHSRFIGEGSNFSPKYQTQSQSGHFNSFLKDNQQLEEQFADPRHYLQTDAIKTESPRGFNRGSVNSSSPWKAPQHRKSFFDAGDFFPEPKQTVSIFGEIENKLKLRGINEPSKDLETFKQIIEALQLKGLLHSQQQSAQNHFGHPKEDSSIVVMKPSRSPSSSPIKSRSPRQNYGLAGETSPSMSPLSDRNVRSLDHTRRSPNPMTTGRSEGNTMGRRSNSPLKPSPLSVEPNLKINESMENRNLSSRRTVTDPTANNLEPRNKKTTVETHQEEKKTTNRNKKTTVETHWEEKKTTKVVAVEDEFSSTSGSSIATFTDTEISETEQYKEELLERCDKLLHSIAGMTVPAMHPSPVSVLDSSFYRDESSASSPVTTRSTIDSKDFSVELEEEIWSPTMLSMSPMGLKYKELLDDSDFVYVSDILRAYRCLSENSNAFLLVEKQQYLKGEGMHNKLIFDAIHEILGWNQQLPPWKAISWMGDDITKPSLHKVWSEFQRIRENKIREDLFETIGGLLEKDLAGDGVTGWGDCSVEMLEVIVDIEQLISTDLILETIRDVAALASRNTLSLMLPRRKLVS